MRRCYLVCYDIRDAKRLRRVHQVCKGYGESWQYSIFFCLLKDIDLVRLRTELEAEMNLHQDQTLILDLGPDELSARQAATILGQPLPSLVSGTVVI